MPRHSQTPGGHTGRGADSREFWNGVTPMVAQSPTLGNPTDPGVLSLTQEIERLTAVEAWRQLRLLDALPLELAALVALRRRLLLARLRGGVGA